MAMVVVTAKNAATGAAVELGGLGGTVVTCTSQNNKIQ
jgi:hypothetical protein